MKTKTNRELKQERIARWVIIGMFLTSLMGFAIDFARADDLPTVTVKAPSKATLKVIYAAAKRFDVDANDLLKIAFVESSFNPEARRVNGNGSVDFGMFQINSVHWSTTCKKFDVMTLKGNALCAAKLLKAVSKHAETDENWLGRYHSKTPSRKAAYAEKLARIEIGGN